MTAPSGAPPAAPALTADQLSQVLGAVKDCMKDEMQSLKRELSQEREVADDRLVKKIRLEKGPTFKMKAHEKQFEFNAAVIDRMEDIDSALKQTPPAVEKARSIVVEGMKSLKSRQKHIRIVDRSEFGWAAVEEYVEDELADGEDDEKRIQRAEFRAGKKLKSARGPRNKKWPGFQTNKRAQNVNAQPGKFNSVPSTSGVSQLVAALLPAIEKMPGSSSGVAAGRSLQQLGPCFSCGRPGHICKSCPFILGAANK